MDRLKTAAERDTVAAFEAVDTTMDAVRLMMEAEQRHKSVHGDDDAVARRSGEASGAKAEAMAGAVKRRRSTEAAPVEPVADAPRRRNQARGKAALPDILPEVGASRSTRGRRQSPIASATTTDGDTPCRRRGLSGLLRIAALIGRRKAGTAPRDAVAAPLDPSEVVAQPELVAATTGIAAEESGANWRDREMSDHPDVTQPRSATFHAEHGDMSGETAPRGLRRRFMALLARYEPKYRHSVLIGFVAVTIWHPWLIPGVLFLSIWIGLIAHLTVGPDRMNELIATAREKLAARFPDKAAELHRRAQLGADRMERLLARLPARFRENIHIPDLGRSGGPDLSDNDPFERLAAMRHGQRGAGTPAE